MQRVARGIVRGRWPVLAVWVIVGIVAAVRAPGTPAALDLRGGVREATEARRADQLLNERFARPIGEFFAVTLSGPRTFDEAEGRAVLDSVAGALAAEPFVRGIVSYRTTGDTTFVSRDRRTTFLVVALEVTSGDSAGMLVEPARETLRTTLARLPGGPGYTARVTGRGPLDLDVRRISAEDSRTGELRLLPLTLGVLVLAFGALVAALLPLAVGFLAIAVSLTIIGVIAEVMPMSIFVLNMTTMIGLGVGIDYSLFIVTRFREELNRGVNRRRAAITTIMTAGHAVVTSGMTVVVGFAALVFTPMIETRSIGVGGLVVVISAVLLSVTFLPALLAVAGRQIDRPRWLARRLAWYHSPLIWEKWARSLGRHPLRALTLGLLTIAVLSAPVFFISIGLPARHWWPSQTESGAALDTLASMGVAGYVTPIRLVVEVPEGSRVTSAASLRGLRTMSDSLRADPRVREVRSIVDVAPGASLLSLSLLYSDLDRARARYPDLVDAYLSRDGRATLLDVLPAETTSLTESLNLVRDVRAIAGALPAGLGEATLLVGGYSAATLDFQERMLDRFPWLVGAIIAATAVMLAIAFRSVLVPIKAVIMNSLSVAATFGLVVLVFQEGIGAGIFGLDGPTEAIYVAVPVLVFAVVFGLSMDYEVFLLSRIKEAYDRTGRNAEATMEGLSATASVITSAALIMILVFGVFAFARILMMQFLGFGLAVAVLIDATIIRMVLVPAFMQLAGRWNWWPGERVRRRR